MPSFRYLDVVLVVLALPIALLLGAPVGGCIIGTVVWAAQRVTAEAVDRRARAAGDVRTALKLNVGALLLRVWLVALGVVLSGVLIGDRHGVAAAVVVLGGMTAYLLMSVLGRSARRESPQA